MSSAQEGHSFDTILLKTGGNNTGIEIPDHIVDALVAGKRPPVHVTINQSYTYRNTVAVMGGRYLVGVSAEHRKGAGIAGGDAIHVHLRLDTEPREVSVPADLLLALEAQPEAMRKFEGLSYSKKQGIVLPILDAKAEETREKRIAKTIENLLSGKV